MYNRLQSLNENASNEGIDEGRGYEGSARSRKKMKENQ